VLDPWECRNLDAIASLDSHQRLVARSGDCPSEPSCLAERTTPSSRLRQHYASRGSCSGTVTEPNARRSLSALFGRVGDRRGSRRDSRGFERVASLGSVSSESSGPPRFSAIRRCRGPSSALRCQNPGDEREQQGAPLRPDIVTTGLKSHGHVFSRIDSAIPRPRPDRPPPAAIR